ncbi:hypothetical protein FI667_g8828, partial [Globisporangium splendens]
MAIRPNFPLPKGYFGQMSLTKEQEERYREIIRRRIDTALTDENEFTFARRRQVDASKWKLVKSKHQLHIYRRRNASNAAVLGDASKQPSMLGVGRLEGTLEDVIYGMYDKSHEEMKITIKYIDTSCKDCTVLHTIDLATPSDPFHYLGFKYLVTGFPGGFVIKPRDWPYLEAAGIERDRMGRRFGYIIMHSVNLPNVAPFDRGDVVRGQLFFSFLFREQEGGFVDIFSQGLFDPAGEMIQRFSSIMTAEALMGICKSVRCAEAKKLTILALTYYTDKSHFTKHRCSVCTSTGGMFSALKVCRVCGATVCSRCRVKKFIFAGNDHAIVNISCCPPCVLKAKTMDVRPADEAFSILGERHLPEDLFRSDSSQYSDVPETHSSPDASESKPASISESEDDDGGYSLSVSSGMSEDDVEGLIEAMMKKKLNNNRRGAGGPGNDNAALLLEDVELDGMYMSSDQTPRSTGHVPKYDDAMHYNGKYVSAGLPPPYPPVHPQDAPASSRGVYYPASTLSPHHGAPVASPAGIAPHQAELFHKMLALQNSAQQVYQLTKANEEYMRNLH